MLANKTINKIKAKASYAAITLLALGLLFWAGLDLYQRIQFHQERINKQEAETLETTTKAQSKRPKNTRQVARQYLFGRQLQSGQGETVTQAPATRLNLKLIGVIAGNENGVSKVIIQIDNSDIGIFSVGDSLPKGNAIIERIEKTQVLLKRNGKLESLAIIRPELETKER